MLFQKIDLHQTVDAVAHSAQLVCVRSREAMAKGHVAIGRNAHQAQPRATRICFAHAFVDFFDGVLNVRKPVVPVLERGLQKIVRERLELAEHGVEPLVGDGVLPVVSG